MAGAARFLDRLPSERRPDLERALLDKIHSGATLDPLLAWCEKEGIEVGRSTLNNFMREIRAAGPGGGSAEQAPRKILREVMTAARAETAEDEKKPAAEAIDHVEMLRAQLRAADRLATEENDPKDRIAAAKLVLQLSKELQEMERAGAAAQQLRCVFYFPHKVRIEMCEAEEA